MSLDVWLTDETGTTLYGANITHNLNVMAKECGIYKHLWRPDEIGITRAGDLVEPLSAGLALLVSDPRHFKKFDASNGWGKWGDFVTWLAEYTQACRDFPGATVNVDR